METENQNMCVIQSDAKNDEMINCARDNEWKVKEAVGIRYQSL
jgi:hypothetical protein